MALTPLTTLTPLTPKKLHISQPSENVVQVGHNHQQNQYAEAYIFSPYKEVLARLAARNHLVEQEEHVAAVEGRDRQDVHKRKDDAEECRHASEHHPVPCRREQAADRSEAAQRLGTVGCKYIFHVVYISAEHADTVFYSGREALKEAVFYGFGLVVCSQICAAYA